RNMPWRNTSNPYQIWLSEVILQQTRIETGVAYLERFLARFPLLSDLASAPQDEVLKYWEGLGYYSRARNLHAAAIQLVEDFGGEFPESHLELLTLKGVGPYTARAIASFAFGEQVAVLDGNVMRVVSRLLGDPAPIDQQKTRKEFQQQLDFWVKDSDSRKFNHGMMDIGSVICTPTNPGCMICPLESQCVARKEGLTAVLPQKGKKLVRKTRYFRFYLLRKERELLIRQRPQAGLWGGLWEIPNDETTAEEWEAKKGVGETVWLGSGKHIFTHFDMHYHVFSMELKAENYPIEGQFEKYEKIHTFAFPRAVLNMFDQHLPGLTKPTDK
ncbi:MAG: A/G-specific adenine glycosylase, partial [Bacteroidia bacterium]|nr:A/G-specific adenine glycosylase [Bacteroidia bacterium]